ncbi:MAG: CPBP family intramembrane metalloprotease [Actinomycetota bacterium]|nr:CPBP family intramembrane metalloprotease [Actinomycetota bacterium]MDQ3679711.1 CPBP family intramembrane metalloprotease [Actinomycetota bacterium]
MRAALALVLVVLVAHNLLGNLVLPQALYVPANLAVAAVLLGMARASGTSWTELGLSRSNVGPGAALGGAAFLVAAAVLVVAALVPATRTLFLDQRVANVTGSAVAYQALVRIPLGTVVLEEVAFRGVLLALLGRATSTGNAVAWSSAMFGLWHVVPTVEALRANRLAPSAATVTAAVLATAGAGALFCWLRLRSGSLVAPALAHVGTNSMALVVAVSVLRTAPGP